MMDQTYEEMMKELTEELQQKDLDEAIEYLDQEFLVLDGWV